MKRILEKGIGSIAMASFIFGFQASAGVAETNSLVEGNTDFALNLYAQLKNTPGNLFFSPYSISTALAMTYAGARGETEQQMGHVLHFDGDLKELSASFGELQRQLNESSGQKGIELNIANALWAQKGHAFLPAFTEIANRDFQARINEVDFRTGAEAARIEVNGWVAQKTKDKIKDILPPGSLNARSRLALVSAIYFKGAWTKPFTKTESSTQPFHLSGARQVDAPLMHHFDEVRYMENGNFQAVEIPYSAGELAMVVLLPRQIDGSGELEKQLTPALFSQSFSQMRRQKVEIFLPRFKLESGFNLVPTLAGMGMPDAFGPKADFSRMDGTRQLFISGVFHKAWGEVNEEGTEAAAATAVTITALAAVRQPSLPPIFRADHPFIFLIRDTRLGSILFLGRLQDPTR